LKIGKRQTMSVVGDDHPHTSLNTKRNNNKPNKEKKKLASQRKNTFNRKLTKWGKNV
jgi:hypothetical protein